ncbi:glycoside hydrolase family 2 protein [Microbacterium sp. BK668]|uniref:glycoside hydrolase family 2 protein n=1 Tax=Microbacterium sp. BK668 TaxID=2512118 RepID=UPI00105F66FC|nr:glycoside hydrolase family 2 protein [Microbacterium sp. BK668]TDN91540.1 beta-mannosidase [Microbacterium sp. BK668]
MTERTPLHDGWTLRLAEPIAEAVPDAVRARLPIRATVPGTVHTDLLDAGLIDDPYIDRRELDQEWIGRQAWLYERRVEHQPMAGVSTSLEFDGLDTIATVFVNGHVAGRSQNMHRRVAMTIDDHLHAGTNTIAVRFDSAVLFAEEERTRMGRLPNAYPTAFNYIRKSACNFGWDWGPSLTGAGIWRDVRLVQARGAAISRVSPTATVDGEDGVLTVQVELSGAADATLEATVSVGDLRASAVVAPGESTARLRVRVPAVQRWWPHGFGEARLYHVAVQLVDGSGLRDSWEGSVGFRTVELITEPDAEGTPFTFVINGATVPVRGANWIPDDCFFPRVTEARVRERITQAVAANTNLLRIWGGGTYESEDFYRVCDELGVMVWQDFLFACAAYPEEEPLRSEVEAEARDNVQRLMTHPSLVLWNGNNENIWGYEDWDWREHIGDRTWGLGYYTDLLPSVVAEVDPSRHYWPGSPYSGSASIHPNSEDHALQHIWDVWNDLDYTAYREMRPRFASEFGWQAPPTWSTIVRSVRDEPLALDSPGMLHHQKAIDGNHKLERGLAAHFDRPDDFDSWLFAMQLNQARAIRFGIEHFRSLRPRNTGTIIWQLNDCWPVTSWAAIDGYGRKKPMWYALRASQATRIATVQPVAKDSGQLAVVLVNDAAAPWRSTVSARRIDFDGRVLAESVFDVVVEAAGSARVALDRQLWVAANPLEEVIVIEPVGADRALWFFAEDRDLLYRPPALATSVERHGEDVRVTITSDVLVRDVCVFPDRLADAAEADDALITLLPGETRIVNVTGIAAGEEHKLLRRPVLRSANDLVVAEAALAAQL